MSEYKLYTIQEVLKEGKEGELIELRGVYFHSGFWDKERAHIELRCPKDPWSSVYVEIERERININPIFIVHTKQLSVVRGSFSHIPSTQLIADSIEPYSAPSGALSLAPLTGGELSLAPEAGQLSLADVVKEER